VVSTLLPAIIVHQVFASTNVLATRGINTQRSIRSMSIDERVIGRIVDLTTLRILINEVPTESDSLENPTAPAHAIGESSL
jgi:hypothetical protein